MLEFDPTDDTALDSDAAAPDELLALEGNSPPPEEVRVEDATDERTDDPSNSVSAGKPLLFPPPHPLNPRAVTSDNINDKFFIIATLPVTTTEIKDWFLCQK